MFFAQLLGGAVFFGLGQSLFTKYLTSTLPLVSGIDRVAILAGATDLAKFVSADKPIEVLVIYNVALVRALKRAERQFCPRMRFLGLSRKRFSRKHVCKAI
jgi:hypothetical protein